jgi:hypothetical protein
MTLEERTDHLHGQISALSSALRTLILGHPLRLEIQAALRDHAADEALAASLFEPVTDAYQAGLLEMRAFLASPDPTIGRGS